MKKTIMLSLVAASLLTAMSVQARNVKYMTPLDTTLAAPEVKGRVDGAIQLYFGAQATPAVAQKIATQDVAAKGRIEARDDMAGCREAIADALAQLQTLARNAGADAVVNITSYYKGSAPTVSDTAIECHAGSHSVGLSLRGDIVKLAK